jgi:hypothetical protein
MKYFQLRISESASLHKVVQQISWEIWRKLEDFFKSDDSSDSKKVQFHYAIRYRLHEHLHKYPNCGLAAECHEDIEGGPWMDYGDKIYMMTFDNFEQLINQISNEVLDDLSKTMTFQENSELHPVLAAALRHELSKYLYFNPSCKRIPFCELQL